MFGEKLLVSGSKLKWSRVILIGCLMSMVGGTIAQERFPNRPVNLIVPFAPGGGNDLVARILSDSLGDQLKQPVIVVNKLGAGGAIGTSYVAKGPSDGYNLVVANGANVTYPEAEKLSGRKPLYELSQIEPIALLSNDPLFLVVKSDSPFKTLGDIVKAAQAKPNSIDYSSSGNLGPVHVAFEIFSEASKASFNHIQYKGVGPGLLALMGGEVQTTFVNPATLSSQLSSGRLRVLAVTGNQRQAMVPDVPTMSELGLNMNYALWTGVYIAVDTPPEVVRVLKTAINQATNSEKFKASMKKAGFNQDYRDAPEFKRFADEDSSQVVKILQRILKPS